MGSTFGGLNILSSSLYAQQAALNTVGHNIANAGTEGYSRQRVNLATSSPAGEVYGRTLNHAGSGVTVASITRARDIFVDQQLWKETTNLGYSQTSTEALSKMEGVFTEPSDTGIQTVLNQFWTSWQALSTNASDFSTRTAVAQRGADVVNAIQHAAQQLKDSAENVNSEVVSAVSTINQITSTISDLNGQIAFMEINGTDHANDLRDSRDLLVDQLAELVDVSVSEDSMGRYTVQSSGVTLVDSKGYTKLDTVTIPNDSTTDEPGYPVTTVVVAETGEALDFSNGAVKALINSRDSTTTGIRGYLTSLETVSKFLLQDFNAVHRNGYGTDNLNGRNFFGEDSSTDYKAGGTPTGGWINALQVNPDITTTTSGLRILASKTAVNGIGVTLPTTNVGSGVPTVSIAAATGLYSGTTPTNVRVRVNSLDSTGKVDGISYTTDDGLNWTTPATLTDGKVNLKIANLDFTLDASKLTAPAVGNSYKFALSADSSAVNSPVVTVSSKNIGNEVPAVSVTGTYTGGTSATAVRLTIDNATGHKYSTSLDGGATWSPLVPVTDPLVLQGMNVTIDFGVLTDGNTYDFSLSTGNSASGDNAILLGNSLKTDISATLGNTSLDTYYSSLIGSLGIQSQNSKRTNTNQQLVIDQLTNLRQSTSGVNMDEEMTNMIRFQKGYNAAARVLTAMDEMLDKLINSTGIVGR